jgi:hypothetical protein
MVSGVEPCSLSLQSTHPSTSLRMTEWLTIVTLSPLPRLWQEPNNDSRYDIRTIHEARQNPIVLTLPSFYETSLLSAFQRTWHHEYLEILDRRQGSRADARTCDHNTILIDALPLSYLAGSCYRYSSCCRNTSECKPRPFSHVYTQSLNMSPSGFAHPSTPLILRLRSSFDSAQDDSVEPPCTLPQPRHGERSRTMTISTIWQFVGQEPRVPATCHCWAGGIPGILPYRATYHPI